MKSFSCLAIVALAVTVCILPWAAVAVSVADGAANLGQPTVIDVTQWSVFSTANPSVRYTSGPAATVVGAIVDSGRLGFDPFYARNMDRFNKSDFDVPWTFTTTISVPPVSNGTRAVLELDGINYKGTLTVNGNLIADETALIGPFRNFKFDVTDSIDFGSATNVISVTLVHMTDDPEQWRNNSTDLGISFYDWAPHPPDLSMGVWRPARLRLLPAPSVTFGPSVTMEGLVVNTQLSEEPGVSGVLAFLNVSVLLRSWNRCSTPGSVDFAPFVYVSLAIPGLSQPRFHKTNVPVPCGGSVRVHWSWVSDAALTLRNPPLWWPWQLGDQPLFVATSGTCEATGVTCTQLLTSRFGIRQVTASQTQGGSLMILINGVYIQFRGGGWAPDLFLRHNATRMRQEFALIRDAGLNGIRIEGQVLFDEFYEIADEAGVMLIPGLGCCDGWQHWDRWTQLQYTIANHSVREIARRIGHHPAVVGFFISSDDMPPPDVEQMYDSALQDEAWPNIYISSASQEVSTLTGNPGVKMVGPYSWVPSSYWLADGNGAADGNYGGAWGFLTEGGPGESPMTMNSWRRTVPEDHLWSPAGSMDPWWSAHMGCPYGHFRNLTYFTPPLDGRYGRSGSAEEYLYKAQAATYEGLRAMFEAYSRNKHINATGIVNWMMNNAYPEHLWHVYDWYLSAGGGYYGTKRALEPVHVMMSPVDGSIWITSNIFADIVSPIPITVAVMRLDGTQLLQLQTTVAALPADESVPVGLAVPFTQIAALVAADDTYFVKLSWSYTAPSSGRLMTAANWYWQSPTMDVLDFPNSNSFRTPCTQWANFTMLQNIPPAALRLVAPPTCVTLPSGQPLNCTVTLINEVATNPAINGVAFLIHTFVTLPEGSLEVEITPQMWSDNFITLAPGEQRVLTVDLSHVAQQVSVGNLTLTVESYNAVVGQYHDPQTHVSKEGGYNRRTLRVSLKPEQSK